MSKSPETIGIYAAGKTYTEILAEFAVNTNYDDLPADVIHATKRIIMDTMGCAIGGYSTDMGNMIVELFRQMGGNQQSTIVVGGDKTSVTNAAYVNSELSMLLDADDTLSWTGHHSCCTVPPILAVAEYLGSSGKELIEAVTVGYDVAARVGFSLRKTFEDTGSGKTEYVKTSGLSWIIIGAAVGTGKLLGLDKDAMLDALGIACSSTSIPVVGKAGPWKAPRQMTKWALVGTMAEAGVVAALLAEKGFRGDRDVLDGDLGFWRMVGAAGCRWQFITDRMGERWFVKDTSFKPYPCCRFIHTPLDLLYKIRRDNDLRPEDIDEVDVGGISIMKYGHFDEGTVINWVDTEFNIPYALAVSTLGVPPSPEWHNPCYWNDPRVLDFKRKVKVHTDPWADRIVTEEVMSEEGQKRCPAVLTVKANAKTFSARAEYAWGDPWEPEFAMSDDDLKDKFRNFSYRLIRRDHIEKAIHTFFELDTLESIEDLVRYLK